MNMAVVVVASAGRPDPFARITFWLTCCLQRGRPQAVWPNPVTPREWFLVPRFVIDEAVERIQNGTITDCVYDPLKAELRDC